MLNQTDDLATFRHNTTVTTCLIAKMRGFPYLD